MSFPPKLCTALTFSRKFVQARALATRIGRQLGQARPCSARRPRPSSTAAGIGPPNTQIPPEPKMTRAPVKAVLFDMVRTHSTIVCPARQGLVARADLSPAWNQDGLMLDTENVSLACLWCGFHTA